LQYLAHWIFPNSDLQGGVSERRLVEVATTYLARKRFEDEDEARVEAENFLEFCKGRAWVLVEVGTANQQPLFQFAHRTFLEYFTAEYLVRNSTDVKRLGRALQPMMGRAAWDVIAQLALQLQQSYKEDAGDALLDMTLEAAGSSRGPTKVRFLSFAVRALEFLVPTPAVTRGVTLTSFGLLIEELSERVSAGVRARARHRYFEVSEQLNHEIRSVRKRRVLCSWFDGVVPLWVERAVFELYGGELGV
jgi:hypothetical protein